MPDKLTAAGSYPDRIAAMELLTDRELIERCNLDGNAFAVFDKEGEHDPCFVVVGGSSLLSLNHWADEMTDVARAVFIARACNASLRASLRTTHREGSDAK